MCLTRRESVCVCMCWHVLDAIVEMSVISIYLFVRWHIKALNGKSHSVFFFFFFVVTSSSYRSLYSSLI